MADGYEDWNRLVVQEFRLNGGTVTSGGFCRSLILLHHIGARSGIERVTPLRAVRHDGETWLIAASWAGAPDHPAWYRNLRARPEVTIETPDDGVVRVRADEFSGATRDEARAVFAMEGPQLSKYEASTTRTIPLIALRKR